MVGSGVDIAPDAERCTERYADRERCILRAGHVESHYAGTGSWNVSWRFSTPRVQHDVVSDGSQARDLRGEFDALDRARSRCFESIDGRRCDRPAGHEGGCVWIDGGELVEARQCSEDVDGKRCERAAGHDSSHLRGLGDSTLHWKRQPPVGVPSR